MAAVRADRPRPTRYINGFSASTKLIRAASSASASPGSSAPKNLAAGTDTPIAAHAEALRRLSPFLSQ